MKCVKKRGQATLLVLLLGLLGLTLAMSSISRSLSDVHQSIQSDTGSRALAAAEAAAEYATTQSVNSGSNCTTYTSISSSIPINGVRDLEYTSCAQSQQNISYSQVGVSDVAVADLTGVTADVLQIFWNNPFASVDVSLLSATNSLSRYAFNAVGSSYSNNFATAVSPTNCSAAADATCPSLDFSSCAQVPMLAGSRMVRVRPFYTSTPIQICAATSGGTEVSIGNVVYLYIGRATMTDGTVKRVQLTKTPGAISGVFDYSLYSEEGSITK